MDSDSEFEDLLFTSAFISTATCILIGNALKKQKKKPRFWVRDIFKNREKYGFNNTLLKELRSLDQEYYFDFMRMSPAIFDWILSRVSPHIQKNDTFWRKSIPPNERLALTLRFLATGESFRSLSFAFRIGRSTVSRIIPETCNVIWECFVNEFMPFPSTTNAWMKIAKGYEVKWQLPHCCGAIDGKHVLRECPHNTGSLHYNYKGTYSSVLMAVADAYYRFIMIDYGHYGSESDGGIFRKCIMGQSIINNKLNLPCAKNLPSSNIQYPHFFVGDEAFPLAENLLRPYPKSELSYSQRIFNYRLCRARRIVENSFGIMAMRFRIFRRPLNYCDISTQKMVLAACILHNILIEKCSAYCPPELPDTEMENYEVQLGQWRNESPGSLQNIGHFGSNNYSRHVKGLRDKMKNYLCGEGAVEWQDKMVSHAK